MNFKYQGRFCHPERKFVILSESEGSRHVAYEILRYRSA